MIEPDVLHRAVDLQQRSYRLLRWASEAVDDGRLEFETLHETASLSDAAFAWIDAQFARLPENARPRLADLRAFANLFATYLEGSFDLVVAPGQRKFSPDAHCFCPMCSWMVDAPRIQPKKLRAVDRDRARELCARYLTQLASEAGVTLSDEARERLLDDAELVEPIALGAYGRDLLRRLEGRSEGPAALALWRRFAWTPTGSPRKDFTLSSEAILEAEARLVERLRAIC
jgi:hypothetical protein